MKTINTKNILLAIVIFGLWFLGAYLINGVAIGFLIYAFMGGVFEPPALWLAVHWFGLNVLPPAFLLGGLPSAVRALRGRTFMITLLFSIGTFAFAWMLVIAIIFWLPNIMGWYW